MSLTIKVVNGLGLGWTRIRTHEVGTGPGSEGNCLHPDLTQTHKKSESGPGLDPKNNFLFT